MTRGRATGVMNIVRFNWPTFTITALLVLAAIVGARLFSTPVWRVGCALLAVALTAGTLVSLVVSHLVYDRSDLYRFAWLSRLCGTPMPRAAVFCQTGFDECSALLRAQLDGTDWTLLDHFDPATMTEPSIQRARRHCPPSPGTRAAPFDAWPVAPHSVGMVIGMLAVHELRRDAERAAWFTEARRVLQPGGCVIVVEHVRDVANLLAFGPGALHFHSVATWQRSWERAALQLRETVRITPWVRVFVLSPAS